MVARDEQAGGRKATRKTGGRKQGDRVAAEVADRPKRAKSGKALVGTGAPAAGRGKPKRAKGKPGGKRGRR
ncbi:hypothetical protein GCM10025858_26770 [Alicyclobacillus sacchari]|uniref:hypothetical protein n=1 Tax=Alicyclobacillus sacchari TaxID=392010 RepID=UPI0023E97087|nr:hypothetical protein [Alicyclobacillus sacchari]GMA58174.1 hypothetical protein GCM10025858_26770 [Alicyclobacillus sacchari]